MRIWHGGLPLEPEYHHIGENPQPRRFTFSDRWKFILRIGLGALVILLVLSVPLLVVLKVKQQRSGSARTTTSAINTRTKGTVTRPLLPKGDMTADKFTTCEIIPNAYPSYCRNGEIVAGSNVSSLDTLNNPLDIFLDNKGNLYVADNGNDRVLKYIQNTNNIISIAEGTKLYPKLKAPTALFVDEYENIYVVDSQGHDSIPAHLYYRVLMYWPISQNSEDGYEVTELFNGSNGHCNDIYLDSDYNIYITETNLNGRIIKWFAPYYNHSIVFLDENTIGLNPYKGYFFPKSIYIDHNKNDLYIVDYFEGSISPEYVNSNIGRIIVWSSNGPSNITSKVILNRPQAITGDCNGNIYVLVDSSSIRFLQSTLTNDKYLNDNGMIRLNNVDSVSPGTITSIALDPRNGDMYIASKTYNHVQKVKAEKYIERLMN